MTTYRVYSIAPNYLKTDNAYAGQPFIMPLSYTPMDCDTSADTIDFYIDNTLVTSTATTSSITQTYNDWTQFIAADGNSSLIKPTTVPGIQRDYCETAGLIWIDQKTYNRHLKLDRFTNKLRKNLVESVEPNHKGHTMRARLFSPDYSSQSELIALSLLKSLVNPRQWRQYLSYGFFMCRGKSGLQYQIRRGRNHVHVFSRYGRKLAELCLNPKKDVPPTDHTILKLMMLQGSETGFWGKANVYARHDGVSRETVFDRQIVEAV